jgi:hypothetical protein
MQVGLDTLLLMTVDIEATWAASVIIVGAEHKHSCGRLVGICVFTARLLHPPFQHVWDGLRADHDRSCQRAIVYFVRLDVDGRSCVRRAHCAAACACRRSRPLAARQPDALLVDSQNVRVLFGSGIITAYTWLTAYEFWRGRNDPLISRWPAIFVLVAYGAQVLLHTPLSAVLPWTAENQIFASAWLTTISVGALLFTIAVAFLLLAIAKERNESRQKKITARLWRWPTSFSSAK